MPYLQNDYAYLQWLGQYAGVSSSANPDRTYNLLCEQLYNKSFEWSVPNDDNRIEDGLSFRQMFQLEYDGDTPNDPACSMLELMLGLADRLTFALSDISEDIQYWFGVLLDNAGLIQFTDMHYIDDYATGAEVDNILNRIIFRTYNRDGRGGFFPLDDPPEDMRGVELWYQLQSYAMEYGA